MWRSAWLLVTLTVKPLLQIRIVGQDRIPKTGGALVLANHTTLLDFLICLWGVYRPVHGLGTEQVFRIPGVGWLLTQLGGAPISKGAKDGAAVRHLVGAYEAGRIAAMFPEGKRSWTGRPLPITRGTGRLVKSTGCPVIFCKVTTGFMQHPRWAKWPRRVPWRMEYSAPEYMPPDATADEINDIIAERLYIDPDKVPLPKGSWGFRLAEGLPDFLWACPACFALESLSIPAEDRDCVVCTACGGHWRVDLACWLNPEGEGLPRLTVATARDQLSEHFAADTHDLALETAHTLISRVSRSMPKPEPIARGLARLEDDALVVLDDEGEELWRLDYSEMTAVLLQFGSALHIRVEGANYQIDPEAESRQKWHHFLLTRLKAAGYTVKH